MGKCQILSLWHLDFVSIHCTEITVLQFWLYCKRISSILFWGQLCLMCAVKIPWGCILFNDLFHFLQLLSFVVKVSWMSYSSALGLAGHTIKLHTSPRALISASLCARCFCTHLSSSVTLLHTWLWQCLSPVFYSCCEKLAFLSV